MLPFLLALLVVSPEELGLLAKSLRPAGRVELESNAAQLGDLPLSEVEATLDASGARIDGQLRLLVRNREGAPWHEVVLRAYPQAEKGTSLKVEDVRVDGQKVTPRTKGSVVEIPATMSPGQMVEITLAFHGKLRRMKAGDDNPLAAAQTALAQMAPGNAALSGKPRGQRGYGTFAIGPQGAVLVDWYPQLAARARGGWDRDEPAAVGDIGHADPSSAVVTLIVPKGFKVQAAGTALGQHPVGGGRESATFAAAGIRGSLGVAASPLYEELLDNSGEVAIRASSLHGEKGAQALVSCAKGALHSLEARFGPYPWTSLSLAEVALGGGAGGVELPGFALIAQAFSPEAQHIGLPGGLFEFTCAHEVAHQWWQGVVGSDPHRAPWVDEALAQYSAVLVDEDIRGEAAAEQTLQTFVALNYHGMRMAKVADGKVAREASQFKSSFQYAGLVYGKAALFYAKARELMGSSRFDTACRAYRDAWAFREAGPTSWLEAARRSDPKHAEALAELHQRWLEERHGDEDIPAPDATTMLDALGGAGTGLPQLMRMLQRDNGRTDKDLQEALKQLETLMPELQRMMQDASGDEEQ